MIRVPNTAWSHNFRPVYVRVSTATTLTLYDSGVVTSSGVVGGTMGVGFVAGFATGISGHDNADWANGFAGVDSQYLNLAVNSYSFGNFLGASLRNSVQTPFTSTPNLNSSSYSNYRLK